jgi:hypothetical protein
MNTIDPWAHIVDTIDVANTAKAGPLSIDSEHVEQNTVVFQAGNPSVEMLKVGKNGFWVRGQRVEQDDKEAATVYNAFRQWMVWAELNRR